MTDTTTKRQTSGTRALDITDMLAHPKGQKALNVLLASRAVLYRTARGRDAVQMDASLLPRVQAQLSFTLVEGLDGTHLVQLPPDVAPASAGTPPRL